jgi:hypothetical protein
MGANLGSGDGTLGLLHTAMGGLRWDVLTRLSAMLNAAYPSAASQPPFRRRGMSRETSR